MGFAHVFRVYFRETDHLLMHRGLTSSRTYEEHDSVGIGLPHSRRVSPRNWTSRDNTYSPPRGFASSPSRKSPFSLMLARGFSEWNQSVAMPMRVAGNSNPVGQRSHRTQGSRHYELGWQGSGQDLSAKGRPSVFHKQLGPKLGVYDLRDFRGYRFGQHLSPPGALREVLVIGPGPSLPQWGLSAVNQRLRKSNVAVDLRVQMALP
ncbi:hypothetical protein CRG98_020793 [Punica granatum]|uniref:Uncharacterized protein n=1 Tax=Punica granatum TaxID=22663 RepID=A0A2I0JSF3_PUNGR|nr:hypothetical protein CRG98_020793 [Punica granatum]